MILWFLVGVVGGLGCLWFGVSLITEGLSAAQFKAEDGQVPGLVKRSAKSTLKLFLISLALLVGGILLSAVCSP